MADDGGLSRFQKRMRAMPALMKADVRKALAASADEIVAMAKRLVPVDQGALRDSIGWTWGDAPAGAIFTARSSNGNAELAITIFAGNADTFYARYVEFGTQPGRRGGRVRDNRTGRSRRSYRTHSGTVAQPFFYPAYRLGRKKALARIKRAISKAVKTHWGTR